MTKKKAVYVAPDLKKLGHFTDLTLGMSGSQNDGDGYGHGMACITEVPNDPDTDLGCVKT